MAGRDACCASSCATVQAITCRPASAWPGRTLRFVAAELAQQRDLIRGFDTLGHDREPEVSPSATVERTMAAVRSPAAGC